MARVPTGLLIIRVWVEQGSPSPLRAQIRHTADVSARFEPAWTYADVQAVGDAVQAWLQDLLDSNERCL
jgi:hypothetical protein